MSGHPETLTTSALARARVDAAADLEHAIAALGKAWTHYAELTTELNDRTGEDLGQLLDVPIVLTFMHAGLSRFLERKLAGPKPSLQTLVDEQQARLGNIIKER
jgi:hypothetical protein